MTETLLQAPAGERQLVTIEAVSAIAPIENADAIETARIRGWNVVVKKGEFTAGDLAAYFEIDSFLPLTDERFAFLAPRGTKTIDGVDGHILRTAKLRGVYSQGLALPAAAFPELYKAGPGADLAALIGVTKYDPPVPAGLSGSVRGPFPTRFAPKTDAERVQNLDEDYAMLRAGTEWVATEKVDGTSVTYINDGGCLRVCGRNWELAAPDSPAEGTTHWKIADALGMLDRIPDGWTVQGELVGENIQANPLKIKGTRYLVFSVLNSGSYVPRHEWPADLLELAVPVFATLELPEAMTDAVEQANGIKSLITPGILAEGIVWHAADGSAIPALSHRSCFKVISNKWLLKHS